MEKEKNTKTLMILMIICVCLSIVTLGVVIYDRFIRKEPEHAVLKPITIDNRNTNNKDNENYQEDNKLLKGTPNNVNLNTLTKKAIVPYKQIKYPFNKTENIKIDDNLTIVCKDNSFDLLYLNKKINVSKKGFNNSFSGVDLSKTFDIYKLGNNYLIKSDFMGTDSFNLMLFLYNNGNLQYLLDNGDGYLPDLGNLSKVEYYSENDEKPFYLITINNGTDSIDYFDDLGTTTYYIYE